METIEILKKTYDDFEKRHGEDEIQIQLQIIQTQIHKYNYTNTGEDEDGLRVESIGPLLGVVGIRHHHFCHFYDCHHSIM